MTTMPDVITIFWLSTIGNLLRYVLFAGFGYLLFYRLMRQRWHGMKVQPAFPPIRQLLREAALSILSFIIFGLIAALVFHPAVLPHTQFYFDVHEHSYFYLVSSFFLLVITHDTWFYWLHRTMHSRLLYRRIHRTHHRFINPSPWAGYAFHPIEAVGEGAVLLVFAFAFPVHPVALLAFLIFSSFLVVGGHLGYEIYPRALTSHPLGRWLNTSTNHNLHHMYVQGNYGLYFRWWDIWCGTTHPAYDAALQKVQQRAAHRATDTLTT